VINEGQSQRRARPLRTRELARLEGAALRAGFYVMAEQFAEKVVFRRNRADFREALSFPEKLNAA
jgi:hypothetical protein